MSVILIVGDSWGVPNYYGPPGVPETDHTEFLLKNLGHTVYNCAINGGSNLSSLARAKSFIDGEPIPRSPISDELVHYNEPVEWLLWFHTEFFREDNLINYDLSIEDNLYNIGCEVYSNYASFIESNNLKVCAIGGQAQLETTLFNYINPDFYITDWRQEILQTSLPNSYHLLARNFEWIPKLIKDKDEAIKILDIQNEILTALENSSHFPDNGHPGTAPHRELVSTIKHLFG